MKKFTNIFAWIVPALLFIFVSASPVSAIFLKSGENLVLPKSQKITEAAAISGSLLTIDSDIDGDLYCVGRDVVVNGNIKGDISCASQSLKINGSVDGNIRAVAQNIEINGIVTRNVTVGSQRLVLGSKSQIKRDVFFGVQNVELGGIMGRDLLGAGETITVTGSLLRNATVTSSNLSVAETSKIGGNLDYYMEKTGTATFEKNNIKGEVKRYDIETPSKPEVEKQAVRDFGKVLVFKTIFSILSFILLGLALVYLDRKNTEKRMMLVINRPVAMLFIGLATLITAPIALIILMMTVVGIPFAFVSFFVYLVALMTASLYSSIAYGKLFSEKVLKHKNASLYWQTAQGVLLLGLVTCVPLIGWGIAFVSFCLGIGAFLISLSPEKK